MVTTAKYDFARAKVGTLIPSRVAAGQRSKVTNWTPTRNGRGVWFTLEDGSKVHVECPSVKGARREGP